MKRFKVEIQGVTPLLCNRFTDEAAMKATAQTSTAFAGDKGTPREQAETKLYLSKKGKPMIPQPNMLRCIIDAGKFFKNGKSKVTTQKSSIVTSCVFLDGLEYEIQHKEPWEVDTRPVRIPSTGGRILCHRPSFNDWKLKFEAELDESIIGEKLFRELVDAAGQRIGLGDFRPDCKGPFGRFKVTSWQNGR